MICYFRWGLIVDHLDLRMANDVNSNPRKATMHILDWALGW